MHLDLQPIKRRILTLLQIVNKPVLIEQFIHYLGEPLWMIHLSLAELLREEKVTIEAVKGHNYVMPPDTVGGFLKKLGRRDLALRRERYSYINQALFI